MRIPINLASQPFRRDRALIAGSALVGALLVATLGVLISLAMADRQQLAGVRTDIDRLNSQFLRESAELQQLEATLRKPDNAEVLERSVFLNALLLRKGISWTRIFTDLEKTLPHNVRIMQIHPSVDAHDRVMLDMQFAAEAVGPFVDLLKAFGESPLFSRVEIKTQQGPTQSEPMWRYRLSMEYAQKL
jgi:type IV pilus assembly protein PilN